jgi:SAM-dependent methyltransferase
LGNRSIEELLSEPAPPPGSERVAYLDLVGGVDPLRAGAAQAAMRSRLVPEIYERWWRPLFGQLLKGLGGPDLAEEEGIALRLLDLQPGRRVLDVACGPGNFTRRFARAVAPGGLAVGLDGSRTMLERAAKIRPAHPAPVYVRADATRLPFRDETFDAVCCFAALHMFEEPWNALADMRRVLRPGGRIALLTSCRRGSGPFGTTTALIGAASGQRMFGREEVLAALRLEGFGERWQRVSGFAQFVGARRRDEPARHCT